MICKKCGNEINDGEKYCCKCGTKIQSNSEPIKIKFRYAIYTVVGIIIAILIITVIGMINHNNSQVNVNTNINNKTNSYNSTQYNTARENLSIENVEVGENFTSSNCNDSTDVVFSFAWSKIKETFPNAKWNSMEVIDADGYGRFITMVNYVRTPNSELADTTYVYIMITDMSEKKGICLVWGPDYYNFKNLYNWGTPLTDEGE